MANQWLRLWHDMPNDPKWRTIARVSKQPLPSVLGVYIHVLVNASNASERGRTQNLNIEDIASALDIEFEAVEAILEAMQGRVLEGELVSGWAKRQPAREDGSAARAKAWRDSRRSQKQAEEDGERTRTQANAEKRPDKDTDTDKDNTPLPPTGGRSAKAGKLPPGFDPFWAVYPRKEGKLAAAKAFEKAVKVLGTPDAAERLREAAEAFAQASKGKEPQYIPHASTWLNGGRWEDQPLAPLDPRAQALATGMWNGRPLTATERFQLERYPNYLPMAPGGG